MADPPSAPAPGPTLAAKLAELDSELEQLNPPRTEQRAPVQYGKRAGDHIAESTDRLTRERTAAELRRVREQVVAALERLQGGGYGRCEICGRAIPEARLEALPWAIRCVDCAAGGPRRG